MAQYCDTDRSTMYKFLSGKRNPHSQQLVERMADFIKLTPVERKELVEAYRVASVGADKYYRRKNIIDFLNSYPSDNFDADMTPLFFHSSDTYIPLQNKIDIQQVLYQMLLRESLRPEGLIQIIAKPSWTYLIDLLQSLGTQDTPFQIQHIVAWTTVWIWIMAIKIITSHICVLLYPYISPMPHINRAITMIM